MSAVIAPGLDIKPPRFRQLMGHPAPLWMLFMTEFWERFAFYGIRWALVLYIVERFYGGAGTGEHAAGLTYGSFLALVYAGAIFGGYVADRLIGYQRSILVGAVFMAAGLFMIAIPDRLVFELGLSTIIVGNGLLKPNISTMVGKLYGPADARRDSGFTIFYMGINGGGLVAPILTQYLAQQVFGIHGMPSYQIVFIASGVGMLISLAWFLVGRRSLNAVGAPSAQAGGMRRLGLVVLGAAGSVPLFYLLLTVGATTLQAMLSLMMVGLAVILLREGIRHGKAARDKTVAMLVIFVFNIMFWMFLEQAGSSFTFLAENIVRRELGGTLVPTAWFQSVNSVAIVLFAPVVAVVWIALGRRNADPAIPRKFGLGLLFNALAFGLLVFALSHLVADDNKIPMWTLIGVYIIQSIGELCLSPIGLSMVTKLAPARLGGLGMGGWFLSTGIGNNLAGIFAGMVSGDRGMSVQSALSGYTWGFGCLLAAGSLLLLLSPRINQMMHGVR